MIRIAAFTGGPADPSSRYRVRQHLQRLHGEGIHVIEFPARNGRYAPGRKIIRPWWAMSLLAERLGQLVASGGVDGTLLQREMMATVCTWEPYTREPRILDVDDAIFLRRGGRPARRLAQIADHVICGNDYLANWFGQWNRNITIIPTSVDTQAMKPRSIRGDQDSSVVIGWIGVSANHRYLPIAESAIAQVLKRFPFARFRVISDSDPEMPLIDPARRDFVRWTPEVEAEAVASLDIGVMPLADNVWERGKCSYKMLQYMACGVPVVVSPVGMNASVLAAGDVGYGATNEGEWIEALGSLAINESARRKMGASGRAVVESLYSATVISARLADTFRTVVGVTA